MITSWAAAAFPLQTSGHSSCCSLNWLTRWLHSQRPRQKGQNHFPFFSPLPSAANILSPRHLSNFLTFIRPSKALSIYLITLSCTSRPLQLRKLIELYLVILPPSAQCRQLINTFKVQLRLIWVGWLVLLKISCLRRGWDVSSRSTLTCVSLWIQPGTEEKYELLHVLEFTR